MTYQELRARIDRANEIATEALSTENARHGNNALTRRAAVIRALRDAGLSDMLNEVKANRPTPRGMNRFEREDADRALAATRHKCAPHGFLCAPDSRCPRMTR